MIGSAEFLNPNAGAEEWLEGAPPHSPYPRHCQMLQHANPRPKMNFVSASLRAPIRIATRASRLALWQAEHVAQLLRRAAPGAVVQIVHVSTAGDRDQSEPLRNLGAFGVFTREVQKAVLDGQADLTVHSLKDLPTEPVEGLLLAGVPQRGPTADACVLPQAASSSTGWKSLPVGARVGTGSLRRQAQLRHLRPDLQLLEIRGNVETRLRKLDAGEYDALVLAAAGLERLGYGGRITERLQPPQMYPAVGQGALGLECRSDDRELHALLAAISDTATRREVDAERALLAALRAGCQAPLGGWARGDGAELTLEGVVLSPDGQTRLVATATGPSDDPLRLGREVAERLQSLGAADVIAAAREQR